MSDAFDGRLDGWGEITAYLRMDRKTVLRRGYPVHYETTGCVYALKDELLDMMRTRGNRSQHS